MNTDFVMDVVLVKHTDKPSGLSCFDIGDRSSQLLGSGSLLKGNHGPNMADTECLVSGLL